MTKKYLPADVPFIITNDLFLASFLHCAGCALHHVETNGRKRVSFVFTGENARLLRDQYRTAKVELDMRLFRDSLYTIRRAMDRVITEERSMSCPTPFPIESSIA